MGLILKAGRWMRRGLAQSRPKGNAPDGMPLPARVPMRYCGAAMNRSWALGDLLATLFERRSGAEAARSGRPLQELAAALMSGRGEVSGMQVAAELLAGWQDAAPQDRVGFFRHLSDAYDLDPEAVADAAAAYRDNPVAATLGHLLAAAEPPRQELLRRLNQAPGGTGDLVRMRAALMDAAREDAALARVDLDFRHLFESWFNRGFLVLRRIDWNSPAAILERIIAYEAVHAIRSWDDLRRRVQPPDRRCFAFFHPAMPDEPLIFVEVALTRGLPGAIAPILAEDRAPLPLEKADTAVFYSISNCQPGLRGISFGNSLIKQVVGMLSDEMPHLASFVTLSPIPGLMRWLADQDDDDARAVIAAAAPEGDLTVHVDPLRRLAARYLVHARAEDGQPLDPVARFHLGNGAEVHEVHALADLSPRGRAQSCGVMVNYRYDRAAVEANHEAYATERSVVATRAVRTLAQPARASRKKETS